MEPESLVHNASVAVPGHDRAEDAGAAGARLVGIDLARAIAFGGMLLAHFALSRRVDDPGWLQALDNAADGRAAPLFCVLLGVGAGLLAARRSSSNGALVRRGLVLLAVGAAVWPYVDRVYLILPQYGVLLASVPLLRRVPTRGLLPMAAGAFLLPSLVSATVVDHGLRSASQPSSYDELLDPGYLLSNLLWTGGYPLVGWVGFVLVGMWVVRQPVHEPRTQWRLLGGGVGVALTQPLVASAFSALGGRPAGRGAQGLAAILDGSAHSNQTRPRGTCWPRPPRWPSSPVASC